MEPLTAILTSWIPIISTHRCGVVRSLEMKCITSWPELQCSHICHFPTRAKVPNFWEARAMFLSKQQMIEVSLSGCLLSCCVPQRINICCTCMWCMRLMMLADSCWNFWSMTISRLLDSAQKGLKVSYFYVPFLNFCCQRKSCFSWPPCEIPNLRVTSHLSKGVVPCCSYPTKYLQSLADCAWLFDDGLFGSCVVLINLCLVSIPPNQIPPNRGYLTTLVHLQKTTTKMMIFVGDTIGFFIGFYPNKARTKLLFNPYCLAIVVGTPILKGVTININKPYFNRIRSSQKGKNPNKHDVFGAILVPQILQGASSTKRPTLLPLWLPHCSPSKPTHPHVENHPQCPAKWMASWLELIAVGLCWFLWVFV